MNEFSCGIVFAAALCLLSALARGRARAYGIDVHFVCASAIVPAAVALVTIEWLAARGPIAWTTAIVVACAAVSTTTDLQTGYVFDRVLAAGALALVPALVVPGRFADSAMGAAVAAAALLIPFALSRGRAMGLGDVKLAALLGLGLGSIAALEAMWVAIVSGGIGAAMLLLFGKRDARSEMRFAPFLAFGAWLVVVGRAV